MLGLGLRPVVELSFMPRDLASDPGKTVFDYRAIVSPPHDWDRWEELVRELTAHLVDRYGTEEVRRWAFEVWNEANLDVFWSGTRDEYLRLYDVSVARGEVGRCRARVGGPASAAGKWVDDLLAHCRATGVPIDFVSTHTYGNAPLDLRPIAARYGFEGRAAVVDRVGRTRQPLQPGPRLAVERRLPRARHGVGDGSIEALAYWTISDHFEELGRPPSLLHGGFGLLAVGNLRNPAGGASGCSSSSSRAALRRRSPVTARATWSRPSGRATTMADRVVAWNGTVDVTKADGSPLLDRSARLSFCRAGPRRYRLRHRRLDAAHSNLVAHGPRWVVAATGPMMASGQRSPASR